MVQSNVLEIFISGGSLKSQSAVAKSGAKDRKPKNKESFLARAAYGQGFKSRHSTQVKQHCAFLAESDNGKDLKT